MFKATYSLYRDHGPSGTVNSSLNLPGELVSWLPDLLGKSYANGFFQGVSHDEVSAYLPLWRLAADSCFVFLKCAFGQLIFYKDGQYWALNPVFNVIDDLGESLDFLMNIYLCDRPGMDASYMLDVYEDVFPRLGEPNPTEMYAFVPALALGGPRDPANVFKKAMSVELPILSQI